MTAPTIAPQPTAATPDVAAVRADGVVHRYGSRVALAGLSIEVPPGSVFGLLGPNGSGKSTFISLLAAMEQPAAGTLAVFGRPPSAAMRDRTGTVFQENAQDPLMSVMETLQLAGRLFGMQRAAIARRADELLVAFGLSARANDRVNTLSGGMRRRLEMARALLHDPELLLLDEPTTGVDPEERRALWAALLGSQRGRRTVLLATNDLSEADAVCEHVAFIKDGAVVASGTPAELKAGLRREAVRVQLDPMLDSDASGVAAWPGLGTVTRAGDLLHITADDAGALVPRLFEYAPGRIRSVAIEKSSLEDAYFQHVSRRPREDAK